MWESVLLGAGPWTGWGVVAYFVVAMKADHLITHRSHMREIGYLSQAIKDRDETLRLEREISTELRKQLGILLGQRASGPATPSP